MSIGQTNHRGHVASACVNCKKVHLACDNSRPCKRCYNLGKSDTCKDVASKKRGRRRINNSDDPVKNGVITIQSTPNIHFITGKTRSESNETKSCKPLIIQHASKESMRIDRARKNRRPSEVENITLNLEQQSPAVEEPSNVEIQVKTNAYYSSNTDQQEGSVNQINERRSTTKDWTSFFVISPLTGLIIKCTDRAASLLGCNRCQLEGVAFFQNFLTSPQSSEFLKGTVKVAQAHIAEKMIFEAGDEALLRVLAFYTAQDIWGTVSEAFQTPIRKHNHMLPTTLFAGRMAMLHSVPFGASCWKMFDAHMAFHNVLIAQSEFAYPQNVPLLLIHTEESLVDQSGWEERVRRESNQVRICSEGAPSVSPVSRLGQMELQHNTRPSMPKRSTTDPEIYRLSKISSLPDSTDRYQVCSVQPAVPKTTQDTSSKFQAIPRTFSNNAKKSDCIKLPPLCELRLTTSRVEPSAM